VLRVAPDTVPDGKTAQDVERLIPFVAAYVDSVSLPERRIVVDWGLDF
jgi:16S rRNA processing protein RimM